MTDTTHTPLRLNGAQALVRLLQAEGVQQVFGIVGGKLAPLLHALSLTDMRYTGVRHEASAPLMAAAVFAASGRMAVALGEMGPGGLNLAAGAGTALNNRLATLLITTNQHRAAAYPHQGMFMDLDTRAVLAPLTKWNAVVHDARRLPELVRTAFREALSGAPGPVHLDVPQDVLQQVVDWPPGSLDLPPARYRATAAPRPDAHALAQAAALLRNARRPLLLAGGGVVQAGAEALLRTLAQRLQAPVLPTQMALGVVASDSPHFIGQGGLIGGDAVLQALQQADVVLAVGCRFSSWWWDDRGPLVRPQQALVNLNLDPSALGSPAVHQVALLADARAGLADLLALLPADTAADTAPGTAPATPPAADPQWLPGLRQLRAAHAQRLQQLAADDDPQAVMHPAALAQAIGQALPADALAVFDGGHTSFWSNDLTPVHGVRTRFHEPGMCQLGFGLPWALALQQLHPQRLVVNITGDGSFGFTLQELDTARRQRLPVVTLVHHNAAWGIIRAGQRQQLDFELGTVLDGTDHAAIARGFGCHGETVHRAADLAPALQRARASGLPAVIDCHVRFEPHPASAAFGRMNRYGFAAT